MRINDLADVIRATGLPVVEVTGWQTRARTGNNGHYPADGPTAVMVHHTASHTTPENDVAYIATNAEYAPISNLFIARDGVVWVIAAGPTNTNGSGGPLGPIPADSMNAHAIGIEAGNDGAGEAWPAAQQHAYIVTVAALCDAYAIPSEHVWSHFEWSPGRKVDPGGPSRWARSGMWDMSKFRNDVARALTEPDPDPGGDPMAHMRTLRFRFDGYAEQLAAFRISADTLASTELDGAACVVLPRPSNELRAQIEAELGRPLTPH